MTQYYYYFSLETNASSTCYPKRQTTMGDFCTFPNLYQAQLYSDCFVIGSQEVCEVNGILRECLPKNSPENVDDCATPTTSAQLPTLEMQAPITIDNRTCDSPFYYQGQAYTECILVDNKFQCAVDSQQLVECREQSGIQPQSSKRYTVNNLECNIPFVYNGQKQNDCAIIDGRESEGALCPVNSTFYRCAPVSDGAGFKLGSAESDSSTPPSSSDEIDGGEVAAIVLSILFVLIVVALIAIYVYRKRNENAGEFKEIPEEEQAQEQASSSRLAANSYAANGFQQGGPMNGMQDKEVYVQLQIEGKDVKLSLDHPAADQEAGKADVENQEGEAQPQQTGFWGRVFSKKENQNKEENDRQPGQEQAQDQPKRKWGQVFSQKENNTSQNQNEQPPESWPPPVPKAFL
eukprot:TRINITY_DN3275_c0_g1_i1.p1 TRINITY_DN3275_c0_g1~~TRINITY_DN3275_c0_g1_i1.p1  ORF type:complete len:405 (-),score=58.55 TRINITY_DN3275_c0_g1_i1:780-1994(-)